jgi:hypothetical protein
MITVSIKKSLMAQMARFKERLAGQPQAVASSRYYSTLKKSSKLYPKATEALMRAERHRLRRWRQFIDPIDLQAIDLLLGFLRGYPKISLGTTVNFLES